MRIKLCIFICGFIILNCRIAFACDSPKQCADLYIEVSSMERTFSEEEIKLVEKMRSFSHKAIPFLEKLLAHDYSGVTNLALFTLWGMEEIGFERLDEIIKANSKYDYGGREIYSLQNFRGEKAIQYIKYRVKKDPRAIEAFKYLGPSGVPYLLEYFRCKEECNKEILKNAIYSFGEDSTFGDKYINAILPLINIAIDKQFADVARKSAVLALAFIGKSAQFTTSDLIALQKNEPQIFSKVVEQAILSFETLETADILIRHLKTNPDMETFLALARLQWKGIKAGPELVKFLRHEDSYFRLGAARTLGYIGYQPSAQALIKVLSDKDDWRLVYVASQALGLLKSEEALPSLKKVYQTHWFPPVRDIAKEAIGKIKTYTDYVIEVPVGYYNVEFVMRNLFRSEFFKYNQAGYRKYECKKVALKKIDEPEGTKLTHAQHPKKISRFQFKARTYSFGPPPKDLNIKYVEDPNQISHGYKLGNIWSYETDHTANVALKYEDVWIGGTNYGEFGGELVVFQKDKKPNIILEENVEDIYKTPLGVIAITGIGHGTSLQGELYKVSKSNNGTWVATLWKRLPGAPFSSWLLEGNKIIINTTNGSVILSPEGKLSMAKCVE